MSNVFAAILFQPERFSTALLRDYLYQGRDPLPGERCVSVDVTPTTRAILYDPGLVSTPMVAFSVTADQFLANDILTSVARAAAQKEGDFAFYCRLFSKEAGYDVVEKYARNEFQGRLIIESNRESITLVGHERTYESGAASLDAPGEFLARELGVDDQAFQACLQRIDQGELFWPEKVVVADEPWDIKNGEAHLPLPPFWKDLQSDFLDV